METCYWGEVRPFPVNCYHSSHFGSLRGDAILTALTTTLPEMRSSQGAKSDVRRRTVCEDTRD